MDEDKQIQKSNQDIKLADLINDPDKAYRKDLEIKLFYKAPPAKWLKPHPTATKKVKDKDGTIREVAAEYLPIDKVEFLLDYVFQEWKIEVLTIMPMFNSIAVTVRVHYKQLDGTWTFHDGVGAQQLQFKKNTTNFSDFGNLNYGAVQMALPSAKTYAIKDACDHIGVMFGRNINRDANYEFNGAYSNTKSPEDKSEDRILKLLMSCKTRSDLEKQKKNLITQEARNLYDELWIKLK